MRSIEEEIEYAAKNALNKIGVKPFLTAANRKELLNKIKELYIDLPMIDGEIDYNFMETYIRAVEKKAIQNVVKWKNLEITKTKQVVNASK